MGAVVSGALHASTVELGLTPTGGRSTGRRRRPRSRADGAAWRSRWCWCWAASACCARDGCAAGRRGWRRRRRRRRGCSRCSATGAGWPTRRGDILRRDGDRLASALTARAGTDPSAAGRLLAAHDLLDEIAGWLRAGDLRGPAAPSAFDRLQVAQALLREHRFGEPLVREAPSAPATPNAWVDDDDH